MNTPVIITTIAMDTIKKWLIPTLGKPLQLEIKTVLLVLSKKGVTIVIKILGALPLNMATGR